MGRNVVKSFYRSLTRRKYMPEDEVALLEGSGLKRALTLVDLTALGVGSTLGVGIYVLAGSVAKSIAGPAVVVSFLIAAVASTFAGLCYAEFAARVPKAGSAYVYSYVCVGEFVAFIIGWNLILEYVVGTASVVRALSGYIDNMANQTMANAFREAMPINVDFLSDYPDFFSFGIAMVFACIVAFGVKESSNFNNVFTAINVTVVIYVIICGLFWVNFENWTIDVSEIEDEELREEAGAGGFMPFGVSGIIQGAATCFYGFVGFDCVATTGEEAKNPQRNIPIAIVISLTIIFLGYFGVSVVLTMMWPYYLQNPDAPLPHVFNEVGWPVAAWIITIGALFGLCASLMGGMFPLPRILYAMAKDGIIFYFLGKVSKRFQTPTVGTLLMGLFIGILAAVFNLQQLVDMMSIGTLLAYSIVAACVLLLRYQPGDPAELIEAEKLSARYSNVWLQLFNLKRISGPSFLSGDIVTWTVLVFMCAAVWLTCVIRFAGPDIIDTQEPYAIALIVASGVVTLLTLIIIGVQPSSKKHLYFRVPLVPVIPGLSILVNLYLMLSLDAQTWIRFAGWMVIGFLIYFCFGIWHSTERKKNKIDNVISSKLPEGKDNLAYIDDLSQITKL